jgi:ribose transport system substrate-binding protein
MMSARMARVCALLLVGLALALIAGCGSSSSSKSSSSSASSGSSGSNAVNQKAQASLDQLAKEVLAKGPNGETPVAASSIDLTPAEIAKVKAKHATAAIVLHYGGNDWSTAQVAGQKSEFQQLGIKVIAVTDANFKPDKQVSDIETVLTKKPNVIVSIPTDPVATAAAYRKAVNQGVKLVFMDNVPKGFVAGKDYVSDVSADNYGNGVVSADLMAQKLGGKGQIGVIFHDADFFVTAQRYQGFTTEMQKFPGIKIVAKQGIAGPDFAGDAEKAATAMLAQHPTLNGIWAVWDVPAEGVLAAARASGRANNLTIATQDLGENVAINMAQGGDVKDLGAQRPFDQGVTEAKLAGYALIGKKAPAYVAAPSLPVTQANVMQAWQQVYHAAPPSQLANAAK